MLKIIEWATPPSLILPNSGVVNVLHYDPVVLSPSMVKLSYREFCNALHELRREGYISFEELHDNDCNYRIFLLKNPLNIKLD